MKSLAKPVSGNPTDVLAHAEIEHLLRAYESALNASDVDAVMTVFAPDGVFMAPNSVSTVGAAAIRTAYEGIFRTIAFDTELTVEEVVQLAPGWAFARTSSNGRVTLNALAQQVPDANHELFILQKDDAAWKIARYAFASTRPVAQ